VQMKPVSADINELPGRHMRAAVEGLSNGLIAPANSTNGVHTQQRIHDPGPCATAQTPEVEHADLIGLLVRRAKELQACALGQSGALRELRQDVTLLRAELKLKSSPTVQRRRSGAGGRRGTSKDLESVSSPSRE
jgi:hypothetical protein